MTLSIIFREKFDLRYLRLIASMIYFSYLQKIEFKLNLSIAFLLDAILSIIQVIKYLCNKTSI